jgi:hypothetical protein
MWSWNIKDEMAISVLHGNLVVSFTDYITGEKLYSFLGGNKVNETADKLLHLSRKEGLKPILKLVPEESVFGIDQSKFKIKEDPNHADYIYDTMELGTMPGRKFVKKRNQVGLFIKNYPGAEVKILDLRDKNTKASIINLSAEWLKFKIEKEKVFESHEEVSVNRLLLAADALDLFGVGIFFNGKMIAFMINELTSCEYAIAHASKVDRSFNGVNSFLIKKNAEALAKIGKKMFNYEQDLGLENLRDAKSRFRPVLFLKKYQVQYS